MSGRAAKEQRTMGAFFKGLGMTLAAALAAAGCGSDDNGGGVSSGIDGSKPADSLETSDAKKVCDAIASYASSQLTADLLRRTFCTSLTAAPALSGKAPTVAECNDSVNMCLMQAQGAQSMSTAAPSCPSGGTLPPGCNATVGEIQACSTAAIDSARAILSGINCDLWGLPPAEAQQRIRDAQMRPEPAECTVVQQKCPALVASAQAPSSSS
jgi:hypothetical protein